MRKVTVTQKEHKRPTADQSFNRKKNKKESVLFGSLVLATTLLGSTPANSAEEPESPTPNLTTVNASTLDNIGLGLGKETVMHQLGEPKYDGIDTASWRYKLNVRKPDTLTYVRCNMQVNFDNNQKVKELLFDNEDCSKLAKRFHVNPPAKPYDLAVFNNLPIERVVPASPVGEDNGEYVLSADLLFDFDKANIRTHYLPQLRDLAKSIQDKYNNIDTVQVIGYTDRIGSKAYNQKLGMQRANSVGFIFVQQGLGEKVKVSSMGESVADQVSCSRLKGAKLHACLQKDRKVIIRIDGLQKSGKATHFEDNQVHKLPHNDK